MKDKIRRLAWIGVTVSVLAFVYQIITIGLLTADLKQYRMQKAAIDAEVEYKTSWGYLLGTTGKSFFDGLTFGIFTDEGMFEESKKWDRWSSDVIQREAVAVTGHNMALAELADKIATRNFFGLLAIISALILVFVNRSQLTTDVQ